MLFIASLHSLFCTRLLPLIRLTAIFLLRTFLLQVVMVVRNIRRSMVEYHDILWDIGYAKTFDEAYLRLDHLYAERPPLDDFLEWRDLRVMDEIYWYGWFIDYYMEGGESMLFSSSLLLLIDSAKTTSASFY